MVVGFDEFLKYVVRRKKRRLQANYQPVVIKALIENDGTLKKPKILEIIRKHNPDLTSANASEIPVFKVLKKGVIINEEKNILSLEFKDYTEEQGKELVKHCDEWIYNVNIRKEIDELKNVGVSDEVIKSLKKFWKLRGKTRSRDQMKGIGVTEEEDEEGKILHGTVRGVYKAEGEEYAQSIQTNPNSKYEMELDPSSSTIKLNYIFEDDEEYDNDIKLLEKSIKNDVPIGVVMVLATNKWKILGLCKIVEHPSKREFVLKSYGMLDEASEYLKNETLKEYDKYNVNKDLRKTDSIDWKSFAPQIDPLESRFQKITDNPPTLQREPSHIDEIIKKIEEGEWAIPDFQRYYRWKRSDVQDFLKSIFDDHYIGSLLLWDIEDTDKEQCGMIRIDGSYPEKLKGNRIVLDGQQRITSLHYAINAPDKIDEIKDTHPGFFYINFGKYFLDPKNDDVETIIALNRKITDEESFERLLFPFYELKTLQKDEWLSKLKKFVKKYQTIDLDKLDDIVEIIRKKTSRMYHTYDIPQIVLSQTTFENVGIIFMNINTKGKPLDVFDLISVKMSAFDVSIRTLWKDTLKQYPKIDEYDKEMTTRLGRYIMEVISLSFSTLKSCKKNDILEMFGRERKENKRWTAKKFIEMWSDSTKYLNSAIKLLEDKNEGFGVIVPQVLPYEPMLPILASLLREIDVSFENSHIECVTKLEKWYWSGVFGERYSQGVDGKKTSDFKDMVEWFKKDSKIPKFISDFRNQFQRIELEEVKDAGSAKYNGILCLIAKKGAIDPEKRFTLKNKKHIDHIFPKSRIKSSFKNSILNMTWLSDITNVSTKKAKMPSKYFPEVIKNKYKGNKSKFLKVLESHFIDDNTFDKMLKDNFKEFLEERKTILITEIGNKIGVELEDNQKTLLRPETEFDNLMLVEKTFQKCKEKVEWVDMYFREKGIKWIRHYLPKDKVKTVKILTSKDTVTEKLRDEFKALKDQLAHDDISCEMHVIIDNKKKQRIHGRWIITKNDCVGFQSTDTISRGAYDKIESGSEEPPFNEWWEQGLDLIQDWGRIRDVINDSK